MVSPLEPGKTYITILVAGDGIRAETKSDPQYITTLGKGSFFNNSNRINLNNILFRSCPKSCKFTLVYWSYYIINYFTYCYYCCLWTYET